jgi:galactokinase
VSGHADPPDALARARASFEARFGTPPRWAASAPGRVNLIGEHIDYSGGHVLPFAIDRRTAVVAGPAQGQSVVTARGVPNELTFHADGDLRAMARRGWWGSYVLGVFHHMRDIASSAGVAPADLCLTIDSDVPIGSGLSSSAALEVATATLLQAAWGFMIEETEVARRCRSAEHEFAGVPCGIMDQSIAVMARADHALLIDCATEHARLVPLPPPDHAVMLVVDTGVRHSLASGEYADRRASSEAAAAALGVPRLCDATPDALARHEASLAGPALDAARHAIAENARTLAAAQALRGGDLHAVGRLMLESHASLRDIYRVSCVELDFAVDALASHAGVYGARMTGGGFGGCAVALVESARAHAASESIRRAFHQRFGAPCAVFTTPACDGARRER